MKKITEEKIIEERPDIEVSDQDNQWFHILPDNIIESRSKETVSKLKKLKTKLKRELPEFFALLFEAKGKGHITESEQNILNIFAYFSQTEKNIEYFENLMNLLFKIKFKQNLSQEDINMLLKWRIRQDHNIPNFEWRNFKGAKMENLDLKLKDLNGTDFSEVSFAHSSFGRMNISSSTFTGADFANVNLREVTFIDCDLRNADLRFARNVAFARFENCNLEGAIIASSDKPVLYYPVVEEIDETAEAVKKMLENFSSDLLEENIRKLQELSQKAVEPANDKISALPKDKNPTPLWSQAVDVDQTANQQSAPEEESEIFDIKDTETTRQWSASQRAKLLKAAERVAIEQNMVPDLTPGLDFIPLGKDEEDDEDDEDDEKPIPASDLLKQSKEPARRNLNPLGLKEEELEDLGGLDSGWTIEAVDPSDKPPADETSGPRMLDDFIQKLNDGTASLPPKSKKPTLLPLPDNDDLVVADAEEVPDALFEDDMVDVSNLPGGVNDNKD